MRQVRCATRVLPAHLRHAPDRPGRHAAVMTAARLGVPGQIVDHLDDLTAAVTLLPGELQQVPEPGQDRTAFGRARYRDATSAAELQESFLAQNVQRAQDC